MASKTKGLEADIESTTLSAGRQLSDANNYPISEGFYRNIDSSEPYLLKLVQLQGAYTFEVYCLDSRGQEKTTPLSRLVTTNLIRIQNPEDFQGKSSKETFWVHEQARVLAFKEEFSNPDSP